MTVKDIKKVISNINDVINAERENTFDANHLLEWIIALRDQVFTCPCIMMDYDHFNCPMKLTECSTCDICELCEDLNDCEYWHNPNDCGRCDDCDYYDDDCSNCFRSYLWTHFRNIDDYYFDLSIKMSRPLFEWFVANILANELEKLLPDRQ